MKRQRIYSVVGTVCICLLCMAVVTIQACRKKKCQNPSDPACENYDPCLGLQPLTANFLMLEKTYNDYPAFENRLDDTCDGGTVVFKPVFNGADDYEWKIGAATYHQDSLELNFSSAQDSTSIPIILTIHKKRNARCFPAEDTILTVTKNLAIRKNYMGHPNGGVYYGLWGGHYTDSPNVYSVVTIQKRLAYNGIGYSVYYLYNLAPGIDTCVYDGDANNYRFVSYFKVAVQTSSGFYPYGYMRVDSTKKNIEIQSNWNVLNPTTHQNQVVTRLFHGVRL